VTALPETGTVHVWLAHLGEFDSTAAAFANEAVRAQRFVHDDDRRRFLAGRALARSVLGSYLGCPPTAVTLALTAFGKPYFNLSHSGDLVALAVSVGDDVGVDVEAAAPANADELVSIVLSEQERRAFERLPSALRPAAFLRCWTRKEALLKAAGTGLSSDPRLLTVGWEEVRGQAVAMPESAVGFAVQDLAVPAGASGSVALAAAAIAVEIRPFPPQRRRPRAMPRPSGLLQVPDKEHARLPEINP
jgi:4'-phosphopantetheinyl transferase